MKKLFVLVILLGLSAQVATADQRFDTTVFLKDRKTIDGCGKGLPYLGADYEVLVPGGHKKYNCIAWSLGITNKWVWPGNTLADFDQLNADHGYHRLQTLDLQLKKGVPKIVLYGHRKNGVFKATHQALQMADGTWTSKLGQLALIRHRTAKAVAGPDYGDPLYVYIKALLAEVTIQNNSQNKAFVAVAYGQWDGNLSNEGWWAIDPNESRVFKAEETKDMYVRVQDSKGTAIRFKGLDTINKWYTTSERFSVSKAPDDASSRVLHWGEKLENSHQLQAGQPLPAGWSAQEYFRVGAGQRTLEIRP
jgi:uncharacterized membrane protein